MILPDALQEWAPLGNSVAMGERGLGGRKGPPLDPVRNSRLRDGAQAECVGWQMHVCGYR